MIQATLAELATAVELASGVPGVGEDARLNLWGDGADLIVTLSDGSGWRVFSNGDHQVETEAP